MAIAGRMTVKSVARFGVAATACIVGSLAAVAVAPPAAAATSPTTVTIQFDDGNADQYQALAVLTSRGMHATFYVNSGPVGDASHMTWGQLHDLAAGGNEIAGHTITHANIKKLKTGPARQEVCGDRVALFDHGFSPVSFAYPFGSFDSVSAQIVADCGYNSGRGVSGVDGRRVFAESIPPADAYATRTPPNVKSGTTLATVQDYITGAEQNGGGWVQLVIHHLCDRCDAYSMALTDFTTLVDWLAARAPSGTVVSTTVEVVGGPVKPPVAP
jgi:peptidoglycan/xylan/chitin deacetylase (PgdA/CDA1 family)